MPQELYTKYHGKISVDKSWQNGILHICQLADGKGYVHSTGAPIGSVDDIKECIPHGPELDKALKWYARKDEPLEEAKKEIKIVDGEFMFTDGSPISSVADLVNTIPPGPILDAAYDWYKRKQREEKSPVTAAAVKVAKKTAKGE
jgi:hypothetical protein